MSEHVMLCRRYANELNSNCPLKNRSTCKQHLAQCVDGAARPKTVAMFYLFSPPQCNVCVACLNVYVWLCACVAVSRSTTCERVLWVQRELRLMQ